MLRQTVNLMSKGISIDLYLRFAGKTEILLSAISRLRMMFVRVRGLQSLLCINMYYNFHIIKQYIMFSSDSSYLYRLLGSFADQLISVSTLYVTEVNQNKANCINRYE